MNKSTAAFLGINPATLQADEIEWVVRMDDAGALISVNAPSFLKVVGDVPGGDYLRELQAATTFPTAHAASEWILKRQARWGRPYGGRFSILPVKVTRTPAVTEVVEISPATTKVELY